MPRLVKKLTEVECRNSRPKDKDYKLYDEGNLQLLVRKSGTKAWQFPFKLNGKRNIYTIGQYPHVSLAEARKRRDEARESVEQGIDPNRQKADRYAQNSANSDVPDFETVAREWHSKQVWDAKHAKAVLSSLELNIFPYFGKKPVNKVSKSDMDDVLKRMEERNALDIARRVNQRCWYVFDYADKWCEVNPATGRSKNLKKVVKKHRPHLLAKDIPTFLQELDNYRGSKKVKLAMELLWLTLLRPGEVRNASRAEIDRDKAMWHIPAERMKMKRPHVVPLSRQALRVLNELDKITGRCDLLFPSELNSKKPISDVTLLKALIILGYNGKDEKKPKFVPHGVRHTASTILNEVRENGARKFHHDAIERQLAHVESNKIRGTYNHAEYIEERAEMLQWWADYLDDAKKEK